MVIAGFQERTKISFSLDQNKEPNDNSCMIAESTLTSKNQTTLPKAVVESLGVKPSDKLVFEIHAGKVTLSARTGRLADLAGAFRHFGKRRRKKAPDQKEMDAAVRRGAGRAYLRSTAATSGRRQSRA